MRLSDPIARQLNDFQEWIGQVSPAEEPLGPQQWQEFRSALQERAEFLRMFIIPKLVIKDTDGSARIDIKNPLARRAPVEPVTWEELVGDKDD